MKNTVTPTRYDKNLIIIAASLAILCFILHIRGITEVYSPFLYGEEMGYWSNAAAFAGYDWSDVIVKSGNPWYTWGYSIILTPLFWIFDNMTLMYRSAIIMNGLFSVLSFILCYKIICQISNEITPKVSLFLAFIVTVYPSFLHQSSIAIVETFLYLMVWLLFYTFLRFEEKPCIKNAIFLGIISGYVYITHNRTVGIILALFLVLLLMIIKKKINLRIFLCFFLSLLAMHLINKGVSKWILMHVYQGGSSITKSDYSMGFERITSLFTTGTDGVLKFMVSTLGKYWGLCSSSFLIFPVGLFYGIEKIYIGLKKKTKFIHFFSYCFYILAFIAVFFIAVFYMEYDVAFFQTGMNYREDMMFYTRYSECAIGVILLFGLLGLYDCLFIKQKCLSLYAFVYITYGISALISTIEWGYLKIQAGNVIGISTQVNSTPGLFFFYIFGKFSVPKVSCFVLLVTVLAMLFLQIVSFKNRLCIKKISIIVILSALVILNIYTNNMSYTTYTKVNQEINNNRFPNIVSLLEAKYQNSQILYITEENLYSYFTLQNKAIHSTVTIKSPDEHIDPDNYDLVLCSDDHTLSTSTEYQAIIHEGRYTLYEKRNTQ